MALTSQARRPHLKVRTGCLTCKARRKKCDEARPFCNRCVTGKFRCDGYADTIIVKAGLMEANVRTERITIFPHTRRPLQLASNVSSNYSSCLRDTSFTVSVSESGRSPAISASSEESVEPGDYGEPHDLIKSYHQYDTPIGNTLLPQLFITRNPNVLADLQQISDLEVHCYSYFRQNTAPGLTTYFEYFLWSIDLEHTAIAVHHPALFKTVAALGAVHRRFTYGISRKAFEYCAHAARLYGEAVKSLEILKRSNGGRLDSGNRQIVTACETLLGIFQAFQANPAASSAHIHSGVRTAVAAPSHLLVSESWYFPEPSRPTIICDMMYQLYCRVTEVFSDLALTDPSDRNSAYRGTTIPCEFSSLGEMKHYLFGIVEETWRQHRVLEDNSARWASLESYEDRLRDWTSACLNTLETGMTIETRQVKAFNLLNLMQCALCLSIQGDLLTTNRRDLKPLSHLPILTVPGEDDFSKAAAEFCEAIDHLYTTGDMNLSYVRSIFEQNLLKHNIFSFEKRLIEESPNPGVNEILSLWTIAKQIGHAQELAIIKVVKDIIPANAISVDIGDIELAERKVLVRYYEPDRYQQGVRWVEQIWSF